MSCPNQLDSAGVDETSLLLGGVGRVLCVCCVCASGARAGRCLSRLPPFPVISERWEGRFAGGEWRAAGGGG